MDLLLIKNELNNGTTIFDMPLRVAYYARVSTDKDQQLNSLDNQIFYYEDMINKNSNWEYAGRYIDEGISGTNAEKRLSFMQMIKDAKNKKFDLVITKEISRFSRSTLDSIKYTQKLLSYGVGVFFQSDNINTLLPDSELRLTIMASIAQEEVRKLSERLRFGYKRSIEKGRVLGQSNILGYDKNDGSLTVNQDQAKIVIKIFNMYAEGRMGVRRIARELEIQGILSPTTGKMFCPDTIRNIIQNPKYKGYYCSGKTISIDYKNNKRIKQSEDKWNVYKDENIPAIVSEELWERANALYRERSKKSSENAQAYLTRYTFSGKLICGEHGTSYHRHIYKSKSKGEQEVWNCKLYRQKGKKDGCDSPTIYTSELYTILNNVYNRIFEQKDEIIDGLIELYSAVEYKDLTPEIKQKESEIDKLNIKKDKLLELNIDGLITKKEFAQRNNKLNSDIENIKNDIERFKNEMELSNSNRKNISRLKRILEKEFNKKDSGSEGDFTNTLLNKIVIHKVNEDKKHLKLEIILSLGETYIAEIKKNDIISLEQIGINNSEMQLSFERNKDGYKGIYIFNVNIDIKFAC